MEEWMEMDEFEVMVFAGKEAELEVAEEEIDLE